MSVQSVTGPCTGVTWNGTALTKRREDNFASVLYSQVWTLDDPEIGTFNIVASNANPTAIENISLFGAAAGVGGSNGTNNDGTTDPASVTVTVTGSAGMVIDSMHSGNDPYTVGAGQTQIANLVDFGGTGLRDGMASYESHTGSNVTMSWTRNSGNPGYALSAVEIKEAIVNPDISVNDTVTITESLTMMVDDDPNVNDTVTITEDVTMMVDADPSVFDTVTITESVTVEIVSGPSGDDMVTITESVTVIIDQLVPSVAEDVAVTEAVTVEWQLDISVVEDVAVSESINMSSPVELPIVAEDVAVTESVTVMVELDPSVNDAVTVTDFSGVTGPILVAAAKDGLIHYRSTEQSQPLMMDEDEVR